MGMVGRTYLEVPALVLTAIAAAAWARHWRFRAKYRLLWSAVDAVLGNGEPRP